MCQRREGQARDVGGGELSDALERLAVEHADVGAGRGDVSAAGVEGHKVHGRCAESGDCSARTLHTEALEDGGWRNTIERHE